MKKITSLTAFFLLISLSFSALKAATRQMEYLTRGVVAVKVTTGVYLSWRFLGTDNPATGFNVYRNNVKLNSTPITTSTNYSDASGTTTSIYKVVPVINSLEDTTGVKLVTPWANQYKSIPLSRPASYVTEPNKYGSVGTAATGRFPKGQYCGYTPNDCSVGDVDGDGEYEIIVKWDPTNSQDNSYYGITGKVYIDCYKLDGTQLWRIDLGKNIRAGAHYTQFQVFDYDGDGLAEVVCRTAPGTIDGQNKNVIMNSDSPTADYRNLDTTQIKGSKMLGTINTCPEYLTLFDGKTGSELNTIAFNPQRGSYAWGDDYYNRCDRFLACTAYLDGVHPSVVMCRGYYTRAALAAYDVVNKKLVQRWFHDSSTSGSGAYGQGNHNLSVADMDGDGYDEIIYGASAIDHDGKFMYRTGLGHGDAMHVSDLDPDHAGLEVWEVHEESAAYSKGFGYEMHDAATGTILWNDTTSGDNGRGLAADIDSRYKGFEMWSTGGTGTYSCKGVQISTSRPSVNFRIYWDGDLQDELLDGVKITKWNSGSISTLLTGSGVASCNSTKATPCLSADLLGDWREEVLLWETSDSSKLRIYTTTTSTAYRLYTPMHDAVYRMGVAWQNSAYNQPPHLGFYIGDGLTNVTQPDIFTVKYTPLTSAITSPSVHAAIYSCNKRLIVNSTETIQSITLYSILGKRIEQRNAINNQEFSMPTPANERVIIVKVQTAGGIQTAKILN